MLVLLRLVAMTETTITTPATTEVALARTTVAATVMTEETILPAVQSFPHTPREMVARTRRATTTQGPTGVPRLLSLWLLIVVWIHVVTTARILEAAATGVTATTPSLESI